MTLTRLVGAAARVTLVVLVLATVACGGGDDDVSPPRTARPPSKVAPRWEYVAALTGRGQASTAAFHVGADAIQWRVTATCDDGPLRVTLASTSDRLLEHNCAGAGFGFSIRTGNRALDVDAPGPWKLVVEQQVTTPIDEPPLPGMTARTLVATGSFDGIDQDAEGRAELHRMDDGRRVIRLSDFRVTANTDLFLWLSSARQVATSEDAFRSPHVEIGALKATAGAQNYVVPESLGIDDIRSVVVWCAPVRTAYGAATLVGK